ncbi:MAG: hypothetical protein MUP76_02635 [Acidimicrobiia bacterium]|nr:hypothetical protein [Acidimicrobiia bacterium]
MRITRRSGTTVLLLVTLAACSSGPDAIRLEEAAGPGADHSFTIPAGAGEAFDRGEPLEILPGELRVSVGEVIEIVNRDDRGHLVGPFFVGAGETLRQRFASPGEFVGICTVHPSGELVLVVRE